MAQIKISELQLIDEVTAGLMIPSDDGIQSYRFTAAQLKTWLLANQNILLPMLKDDIFSGLTEVSPANDDFVVIADTSDSNKNKKALVSAIARNTFRASTGATTVLATDRTVRMSGASADVTFPAIGNTGARYTIKHNGTSLTQVYTLKAANGTSTFEGVASGSYKLFTNGEIRTFEDDGTNWTLVESRAKTGWSTPVTATIGAVSSFSFTITSASATVGALYMDASTPPNYFTVQATIASQTTIVMGGLTAPAASGTLTKVSGTGASTLTYSARTTTNHPVLASVCFVNAVRWMRDGAEAVVDYRVHWNSNSGAVIGSGEYLFGNPPNLEVNTSIITPWGIAGTVVSPGTTSPGPHLSVAPLYGMAEASNGSGYTQVFQTAAFFDPNTYRVAGLANAGAAIGNNGSAFNPTNAASGAYSWQLRYPVKEWQP